MAAHRLGEGLEVSRIVAGKYIRKAAIQGRKGLEVGMIAGGKYLRKATVVGGKYLRKAAAQGRIEAAVLLEAMRQRAICRACKLCREARKSGTTCW